MCPDRLSWRGRALAIHVATIWAALALAGCELPVEPRGDGGEQNLGAMAGDSGGGSHDRAIGSTDLTVSDGSLDAGSVDSAPMLPDAGASSDVGMRPDRLRRRDGGVPPDLSSTVDVRRADAGRPTDSGSPPPSGCTTGGSGGAAEDVENQTFADSTGRRSSYHLYAAGLTLSRPVGLLVFLHGDGGSHFRNTRTLKQIVAKGKAANLIGLAVLTPDTSSRTWWRQSDRNAVYLGELIENLYARYNIDRRRVLLTGFSGGADFTARYFVPHFSSKLCGGGAVPFGGGGPPYPWTMVQG